MHIYDWKIKDSLINDDAERLYNELAKHWLQNNFKQGFQVKNGNWIKPRSSFDKRGDKLATSLHTDNKITNTVAANTATNITTATNNLNSALNCTISAANCCTNAYSIGGNYTNTINTTTDWTPITTITCSNFIDETRAKEIVKEAIDQFQSRNANKKEKNENMNMKDILGSFGPVTDGSIALSIKGIAVKNPEGKYVAYDEEKEEMYDVSIMHFDLDTPIFYRIPVSLTEVQIGDIIVHNKHYCYVVDGDGKQFTVIDINMSEQRIVLPQKSPFGFNYIIKVISLIKPGEACGESPFGNMLPFILMSGDKDTKNMLPFLLMSQGNMDFQKNPMLFYCLMKDGNMNDMLPFLLMNGGTFKF